MSPTGPDVPVVSDGEQPQTWYFTFGVGQPNVGAYYAVEGMTYMQAREVVIHIFGTQWSMQYDEERWMLPGGLTIAEKYGLRRIS